MDIRLNVRYRLHSEQVSQYIKFEYLRRHCFAVENRLVCTGLKRVKAFWNDQTTSSQSFSNVQSAVPHRTLVYVSVSSRRFDSPTALSGLVSRRRSVPPLSRTYLGTVSHVAFGAFESCFLFTHTTGGTSENVSCQTKDAHQVTA